MNFLILRERFFCGTVLWSRTLRHRREGREVSIRRRHAPQGSWIHCPSRSPTNRGRLRGFSSPSTRFCWGTKKAPGFSWRVSTLNFAWGVPIIFKLRRICVEKASLIFSFFARRSRLDFFRYFRNSKKMHCRQTFSQDVDFFTCKKSRCSTKYSSIPWAFWHSY